MKPVSRSAASTVSAAPARPSRRRRAAQQGDAEVRSAGRKALLTDLVLNWLPADRMVGSTERSFSELASTNSWSNETVAVTAPPACPRSQTPQRRHGMRHYWASGVEDDHRLADWRVVHYSAAYLDIEIVCRALRSASRRSVSRSICV